MNFYIPNVKSKITNIAIIGGGASGLFLAKCLSEHPQFRVTVFEKNDKIAAKLRASGGGRANILNNNILPENYNSPLFVSNILQKVSPQELKTKFLHFGLPTVADDEGRVYPATQFSQTVVDVLTDFPDKNVKILENQKIDSVNSTNGKWFVNDFVQPFDSLVLASGSPANILPKSRVGYNSYLKDLDFDFIPLKPSLSGFKLKNYPKDLSGCRTKVVASLFQKDKLIHKEKGEVIFKDDGISGIVIMNLSAYYARLKSSENCRVELNLTYWDEDYDIDNHLKLHGSLSGILHPKLAVFYKRDRFNPHCLSFEISDVYPIENAQVCSGGVSLSEIGENFEAKKYDNLYAIGELLNVDGVCGGYNLFFAFASAFIVAEKLISAINS